jgi:hypothetical protein
MAAPLFAATLVAVAVTAAQDVFEIVAPSDKMLTIREVLLGQYTDAGDTAAEILSVTIIRGFTVAGTGGASVTPASLRGGGGTSTATVLRNNTTVANTGTTATLRSEAWNIQAPYIYSPEEEERIIMAPGERLVVRITAPADSITLNGTLVYEEGR